MSPTRRDILKVMLAMPVVAAAIPPTVPAVADSLDTGNVFDTKNALFDAQELIEAYCPEYLEGMIVVYDPHRECRKYLKIELFSSQDTASEDHGMTAIRLSSFVDDHELITISSRFADLRRLMVALAGSGEA